ncbi:VOC family protein [Kitasatospora terrestris]|uniref:VOC domain-containing protein n=1 Tax=Kitasatospora terrestris TaxID=258051 RepID=A0ABP9DPR2_9ACTN
MTDIFTAPTYLALDDDPFEPCAGLDAVVLAVPDPGRSAELYRTALALRCTAHHPGLGSYLMEGPGLRQLLVPGSGGVVDLALRVDDAYAAFDYAVDRGAVPVTEPYESGDHWGTVVLATVALGPATHTLVDRGRYLGPYLPGYVAL